MNLKKTDKILLDNLAFMFRQEQGVKVTEPVSVHQMLRNNNIIASFQPLSQGFEGMAIKLVNQAMEKKLFMLINTSSNYSRQRFTACHELYHLLYQDNFTVSYDTNDDGEGKEIEEQAADYFARCLLFTKGRCCCSCASIRVQERYHQFGNDTQVGADFPLLSFMLALSFEGNRLYYRHRI